MKNSLAVMAISVALVGVAGAETTAPKVAPVSDVMTLVATDGASSGGGLTAASVAGMTQAQLWALVLGGAITLVALNELLDDDKKLPTSP